MSIKDKYLNTKDWAKNNLTKENLKLHLADSTTAVAIFTPISAFVEKYILSMDNYDSFLARASVITLMYSGVGTLISRAGEIDRRWFKLEPKSKEKIFSHDIFKIAKYSFLLTFPFYLFLGCKDLKEVCIGAAVSSVSAISALIMSDVTRSSFGLDIQYSKNIINKLKPKAKKGLVTLIAVASIASTTGVYKFNPDKEFLYNVQEKAQEIFYSPKKTLDYLINQPTIIPIKIPAVINGIAG